MYTTILAGLGLLLSIYAYHVEKKIERQEKYAPMCDIRDNISCSKAFTSEYGHIAGFSNSLGGVFAYAALMFASYYGLTQVVWLMILGANLTSLYLAYISWRVLRNYCLVCNSIYLVNIALLMSVYLGL